MAYEQPRLPIMREGENLYGYIKELVRFLRGFTQAAWNADKLKDDEIKVLNESTAAKLGRTEQAADSAKLGGKAPEYYIQPRNLLDNSDFTNPVNQRGETSYTGDGEKNVYTIDRWLFSWQAGATLTVGDGFIQKSSSSPLVQFISGLDVNKTYTVALAFLSGDVHVYSGTITNGFGEWNNSAFVAEMGDGRSYIRIGDGVVDPIIWAALYEGEYTADTLPPYVAPDPVLELAKCKNAYKIVYVTMKPTFMSGTVRVYRLAYGDIRPTLNAPTIEILSADERIVWSSTGATFTVEAVDASAKAALIYASGVTVDDISNCYADIKLACIADL